MAGVQFHQGQTFLLHSVETGSTSLIPNKDRRFLPQERSDHDIYLTTHLHLARKPRMVELYYCSIYIHNLVIRYEASNHRDNFIFIFLSFTNQKIFKLECLFLPTESDGLF
jgi:hypothetical protein